ncbi:MAG: sulfite oxidase [Roseiflexaceae bacterium]
MPHNHQPTDRDLQTDQAAKDPELLVRQADPLNGGPPPNQLVEAFITPTARFFVRSHAHAPVIDADAYTIRIDGLVERPQTLTLADLGGFPRHTITATLQCAGNRRDELLALGPIPDELAWGSDAISTADWSGVRLSDLLAAAGARATAAHVAFLSHDLVHKHGQSFPFGASIPLHKALANEVLLADQMNGEQLPAIHGGPIRLIVPGYIGARSVKWLAHITLQTEPSANYFQTHAYKLFPPTTTAATVDWSDGMMLGELSVTSAICTPSDGCHLSPGPLRISGYAMAGGDRTIERVEFSLDAGQTWQQAQLGERKAWAWRFWEGMIELKPGRYQLMVRAWDSAANTQPAQLAEVWNFKGYMNNAWHRIQLIVDSPTDPYQ